MKDLEDWGDSRIRCGCCKEPVDRDTGYGVDMHLCEIVCLDCVNDLSRLDFLAEAAGARFASYYEINGDFFGF